MNSTDLEEPLTVLYDQDCGLCRRLAEYGAARASGALEFIAWQDFVADPVAARHFSAEECAGPPHHLRTIQGETVREDGDAWAVILSAYPPFESLAWIATRLGLLGVMSHATYHGGQWLRGRCGTCS